jgi:restriction system protein
MKRSTGAITADIFEALIKLPSWIPITLGCVLYALIEWFQRSFLSPANNALMTLGSSIYAPLALVLCVSLGILGAVHRAHRFRSLEQQTGLESIRSMRWRDFERMVAELYSRQGYSVDYQIEQGPDGGVDVVLKRDGRITLVQCKNWKVWSVGVAVVREMFGVLHHEKADEVIIVTTGDFSEAAVEFAKGKPIQLIDGPALWELVSRAKSEPATPACPDCGLPMIEKKAGRGQHTGKQFWGCSQYPQCKGLIAID